MQGSLFPDGIDTARGAGFALTHDPYLIHFLHRWWAWIAVAALVILARRVKPHRPPRVDRDPLDASASRSCSASPPC